jgi:hypothetical protein
MYPITLRRPGEEDGEIYLLRVFTLDADVPGVQAVALQ